MEKYIPSLVKEDLYKILVPKLEILDENMTEVRQRMTSLSPDEWKNLHDYLLVRDTQATLGMEGIPLDLAEVSVQYSTAFVNGIPPESRKAMEGMFAAINLITRKAERGAELNLELLLDTHMLVYHRINFEKAGKLRDGYVQRAGSTLSFCGPGDVKAHIEGVFNRIKNSQDHPVIKAALTGYAVFRVHPFFDGNSRTSRLLQNMVLTKNGYMQAHVPEIMAVQFEKQREAAAHGKPEGYYRLIFDLVTRELKMARDFLGMPPFEPKKMSRLT